MSTSRDRNGNWSRQESWQRLPRVSASQLRETPPGKAMLIYHTYAPVQIDARLAYRTRPFSEWMGWDRPLIDATPIGKEEVMSWSRS